MRRGITLLCSFRGPRFPTRKRYCSHFTGDNIRVRFAPSPTGYIHLGGLRTALYNHLFAKSHNGTTILRIEDTDQTRLIPGATENIIEDLKWCGIIYDEGPYFQSQRKDLYVKYAEELVESGSAYHCFCTQARLNMLRKEQMKNGETIKYDNRCRFLSRKEIDEKLSCNEAYCIRFKLSDDITEFEDLVYGSYNCNLALLEGDPVILKADGYPTYHLANVVDDHDMNITHVLRGSEWLVSTIKHLLLFKAFKWKPPEYGHLPLLLNSDGSKFSKRQNDLRIRYFQETGVLPNALVNLVTRAGGGFDINHADRDEKNFTMDEFINMFNLSKVHKNSCKLPIERLNDCNRLEIKRMLNSKSEVDTLIQKIQNFLTNHLSKSNPKLKLNLDKTYILKVLDIALHRIYTFNDLLSKELVFMWIVPDTKFEEGRTVKWSTMEKLCEELPHLEWNGSSLIAFFKAFSSRHGVTYSELMQTMRLLLTNNKDGPPVTEIFGLLGKETTIDRLKTSLAN